MSFERHWLITLRLSLGIGYWIMVTCYLLLITANSPVGESAHWRTADCHCQLLLQIWIRSNKGRLNFFIQLSPTVNINQYRSAGSF